MKKTPSLIFDCLGWDGADEHSGSGEFVLILNSHKRLCVAAGLRVEMVDKLKIDECKVMTFYCRVRTLRAAPAIFEIRASPLAPAGPRTPKVAPQPHLGRNATKSPPL
jgi:hypothetical protein